MKKGILVVSFGTTYRETREKNIGRITQMVRETYPGYLVAEAFSSAVVRRVLKERDGIAVPDVREALKAMHEAGVERVVVFPTHIIDGIENNRMKQDVKACLTYFDEIKTADVLLAMEADYDKTAKALWQSVADAAGDSPVIFMGHGSEHTADACYARFEEALKRHAPNSVYVATVEGSVSIDDVLRRLIASGRKSGRVLLAPFMLVAGDHANNDMAGEEDSFAEKLRDAGYEPECILKGIGEYPKIRECYLEHLRRCIGEKQGILYGIGVGPGDPELMTLKALRCIRESEVVILPAATKEACHAYRIAVQVCPEIDTKELCCLPFPMTKDAAVLEAAHQEIYERIKAYLDAGRTVAFLTIGDPAVYSTYGYIHRRVKEGGGRAKMISGVPSFCAAAGALGISLGDNRDEIHIIPGSYDIEASLALPGTRVYMKSGRTFDKLKHVLEEQQKEKEISVYCVENCGMQDERKCYGLENMDAPGSYLATLIVKEEKM